MLFDPKLISAIAVGTGFGATFISISNNKCSPSFAWLFDTNEPIMDCNDNGKHYKIYLAKSGGGAKTTDNIFLKVFDEIDKKVVRWNSEKKREWKGKWRIYEDTDKQIKLMVNDDGTGVKLLPCTKNRIKISQKARQGLNFSNGNVDIIDVEFTFDSQHCRKGEKGKKECDLKITEKNHNLEWENNFKPKIRVCDL